tara:strand:- start:370 stop:504 length:135 start_codon:yes stop_codon:yes gene_type:complete
LQIKFGQQLLTFGQQAVEKQNLYKKLIETNGASHIDQNSDFFGK